MKLKQMKQFIVDAFTEKVFHGNPAAICILDKWVDEKLMMNIAAENNLSETAFIVKEEDHYHLRWFTPTCEVGLCGHATLASAFVILNNIDTASHSVYFNTSAGILTVNRKDSFLEMLFPNIPLERVKVSDKIVEALGCVPIDILMGKDLDLICVLDDTEQVKNFVPNADLLKKLPGRMIHITAKATDEYDCHSRCFGPKIGILEDPVCGSAHCQLIPYWSKRLGKKIINAWDASPRGGYLQGEIVNNEQMIIRGKAVLFSTTNIQLEL